MPDGSLLDLGNLSSLIQAKAAMDRNRIAEQNSITEMGRLDQLKEERALEQQRLETVQKGQTLQTLLKLSDDPAIRANPQVHDTVLSQAGKLAGVPDISPAGIARGRDAYKRLLDSLVSGNETESKDAFLDLQAISSPEDFQKLISSAQGSQKLREYSQNMQLMRQTQALKFERLDQATAKIIAGDAPYIQGVRDFTTMLNGIDEPGFKQAIRVIEKTDPRDRALVGKSLAGTVGQRLTSNDFQVRADHALTLANQYGTMAQTLQDQLRMHETLGDQAPLPNGLTKRDVEARIDVGSKLLGAYTTLSQWGQDPFNPVLLKEAKQAQAMVVKESEALANLKTKTQEEALALRREAQSFRSDESGKKHLAEAAQNFAQNKYVQLLEEKQDPLAAARQAVQAAKDEYGLIADSSKFVDPSKKGRVELGVKFGQEDTSRNLKLIDASQGVIDLVGDLKDRITANPAIIGKGAQLGTAFAGAGQQLRAVIGMDPDAAKFLNTKPRDEAEALHEILVYLQARTMDPSGTLDVKVVQHARAVIGDLSSFTTGPTQVLNKLNLVTANAERSIRKARRNLKGGIPAALTDEPATKPLAEMSEKELMEQILKGLE